MTNKVFVMQKMLFVRLKNIAVCAAFVLGGGAFARAQATANDTAQYKLVLQQMPTNTYISNTSNPNKEILFFYNPRQKTDGDKTRMKYDTIKNVKHAKYIGAKDSNVYLLRSAIKGTGNNIRYTYNTDKVFDKYWNALARACNLTLPRGKVTLRVVFCGKYVGITAIHDKSVVASMCMETINNTTIAHMLGEKITIVHDPDNRHNPKMHYKGKVRDLPDFNRERTKHYITRGRGKRR